MVVAAVDLASLVLVVLPAVLIVAAAFAAAISIRNSTLRIGADGVTIHNDRQPPRVVALADVDHFEPRPRVGLLSSLQPAAAVLVLNDGTRIPVRAVTDTASGARGVDALNQRLDEVDTAP